MGDRKQSLIAEVPGGVPTKLTLGGGEDGVHGIVGTSKGDLLFSVNETSCVQSLKGTSYLSKAAAQLVANTGVLIGSEQNVDVNAGNEVNIASGRAASATVLSSSPGSVSKNADPLPKLDASAIETEIARTNLYNAHIKNATDLALAGSSFHGAATGKGGSTLDQIRRGADGFAGGFGVAKAGYDELRAVTDAAGVSGDHFKTADAVAESADGILSMGSGNLPGVLNALGETGVIGGASSPGGVGEPSAKSGTTKVHIFGSTGVHVQGFAPEGIQMLGHPNVVVSAQQEVKVNGPKSIKLDAGVNLLSRAGHKFETVCSVFAARASTQVQITATLDATLYSVGSTTVQSLGTCNVTASNTNVTAGAVLTASAAKVMIVGGDTTVKAKRKLYFETATAEISSVDLQITTDTLDIASGKIRIKGKTDFSDRVEIKKNLTVKKDITVRNVSGKTVSLANFVSN